MEYIAKCGCYLYSMYIRKMINFILTQTSEAQVDYLQCAVMFQVVVSVKGLEQTLDCIFFQITFSFL